MITIFNYIGLYLSMVSTDFAYTYMYKYTFTYIDIRQRVVAEW